MIQTVPNVEETYMQSMKIINFAAKANILKLRNIILSLMENIRGICGMLNVYVHDARKDFGLVIQTYRKMVERRIGNTIKR